MTVISECGTTQNENKMSGKAKLIQNSRCGQAQKQTECGNIYPKDSQNGYNSLECGPTQSNQDKETLKSRNLKKHYNQLELNPAKPEQDLSHWIVHGLPVAKLNNIKAQVTAKTRPKNRPDKDQKQSQALKNWLVCGQTKVEIECKPDSLSRVSTECGIELNCTSQNDALYQAVESYEICSEIVFEKVREVLCERHNKLGLRGGGTQFESEYNRRNEFNENKRKMRDQPSIQTRKRRKKDVIGGEIPQVESKEMGLSVEKYKTERDGMKFWLNKKKSDGNLPNNVQRRKSSTKTPELKRIKFKKKIEPTLKGNNTKKGKLGKKVGCITEFFENWQKQNLIEVGPRVKQNTASGGGKGLFSASGKVENLSLDRAQLGDYNGCLNNGNGEPSEFF